MRRIKVSNKGEIENGAFALLGASTKEGQDKIGFFGSGNKYAMATLLRKGIPFRVFSGEKEVTITTVPTSFGGQTYQQIYIDDIPTSFTTRMGPTWEAWYALREIVCNAIDEGEHTVEFIEDSEELNGVTGFTNVYVDLIDELESFEADYEKYFITEEPIVSEDTPLGRVDCYAPSDDNSFVVFRKHIRATPLRDDRRSLFRYSFDNVDINESRVIQYDFQMHERIGTMLAMCSNESVIRRFIVTNCDDNWFESTISWTYIAIALSAVWRRVIGDYAVVPRSLKDNFPAEDLYNCYVLPDRLAEQIARQFPDVIVYGSENKQYETVDADDSTREKALRAIAEVDSFGLPLSGYNVEFAKFYRPNVMAHCDIKNKTIRLSIDHMDDYDELVSTVYEEVAHTRGLRDCTREFEQYLMRVLVESKRRVIDLESIVKRLGRFEC